MKKVPVALVFFNRPEITRRTFEAIARYRPDRLLLVADGPRSDHPEDETACAAAREVVSRIDWDCDVSRNYSDVNLNSDGRPRTGIQWTFEQVEEAIIFEDDCLPHPDFFRFCEEMLARYRDEDRVMAVSGHNLLLGRYNPPYSYYFYRHFTIWGWATWRRAWRHFDRELSDWPERRETGWLDEILGDRRAVDFYRRTFDRLHDPEHPDSIWEFQWAYSVWARDGLGVAPRSNLVSNIGFGSHATHTMSSGHRLAALPTEPLERPLRHPPSMQPDRRADRITVGHALPRRKSGFRRLRARLGRHRPAGVPGLRRLNGAVRGRARGVVRRMAYHHYRTARLYYRRQLAREMTNARQPVVVYQMGKVGGETVATSLRAARPEDLCWCVHWLTQERLVADEALFRRTWNRRRSWKPHGLWKCQFLRERVLRADETERWKIITLVGDPVERNISVFFEILAYKLGFDYEKRIASDGPGGVVAELSERFWTQFAKHREPLTWFDSELQEVFGIDVFAFEFPKERGYRIYRGESADVLLLKREMLRTRLSDAVRDFLGEPAIKLTSDGPGWRDRYAEVAGRFIESLKFPNGYLDEMYGSRLARHFYTPEELETFRSHWQRVASSSHARALAQ